MQEIRTCTKCKLPKSINDFGKRVYASGNTARNSQCKKCIYNRTMTVTRPKRAEYYRVKACESARNTVAALKDKVFAAYGNKCACCGETERQFLTLDHVNGGGTQHIKKYSVIHYRDAVKRNYPDDYRVLCFNCNCGRRNGVCPHQLKQNV